MKTKYLFLAALAGLTFASCADDAFVGDNSPTKQEVNETGAIKFGFNLQNTTRADIVGNAAAEKLGSNFYVMGTKGSEGLDVPSITPVFDNYLVHYAINTAGKTESNTANWEYVGVNPPTSPYNNYVKLSKASAQTIKYWDYSTTQYDFLAFSTGTFKAVENKALGDLGANEINVTPIASGATLKTNAYTFKLQSTNALENTYITDIVSVKKASYGQEVVLKFKNLGSKIRIALYETVPGYSIDASSVEFYTVDETKDFSGSKGSEGALISTDAKTFATKGTVQVKFPNMGTSNANNSNYNKAAATVTELSAGATSKTFGALENKVIREDAEETSDPTAKLFIGRSLTTATFAGDKDADYYKTVFPVSSTDAAPLTLRVNYTLKSIDGSGETIKIYGAKAVVPAKYTVWQPNYAYTYIFKISDNTNGWTSPDASTDNTDPGLFPITFDAVVAQATDASGEQTTVTTVATPSITTYQQGHKYTTNEYSKTTKGKDDVVRKLYVQVMDNSSTPAKLVGDGSSLPALNTNIHEGTPRSLLYLLGNDDATEAMVMDALQNQGSVSGDVITGRNGLTLTKNANITSGVTSIVNGVDDNPITVAAGSAAEIAIGSLTAGKTYAYVYDYSDGSANKTQTTIWQPSVIGGGAVIPNDTKYITVDDLNGIGTFTAENEAVNSNTYLYFSKTTNGTSTTTYSYYSVDGKKTLPEGLLRVNISSLQDGNGTVTAADGTFVFTTYIRNNGKYAVKVIKIVA